MICDGGRTELTIETDAMPTGDPVQVERTLWSDGWLGIGSAPANSLLGAADPISLAGEGDLDATAPGVSALLRPQQADDSRFSATLDAITTVGAAGVAVYTGSRHHYSLLISGSGASRVATLRRTVDDLTTTHQTPLPGDDPVTLNITARPDAYTFSAAVGGVEHHVGQGAAQLLSAESVEWFVAAHFALVHVGDPAQIVHFADVESVDIPPLPPRIELPF